MAPATAVVRAEKERRLNSLISFAGDLQLHLSTTTGSTVPTVVTQELEKQIRGFPSNLLSAVARKYHDLDGSGTALWNLCTRLGRNEELNNSQAPKSVLLMVRVFAFLILDCAQNSEMGTLTNAVRLMKVALKTARSCIDAEQHEFAMKVLEKAAEYEELLEKQGTKLISEDEDMHRKLSSEYFVIRTAMAWRQDKLDVAEHMYHKASVRDRQFDPHTAENLADLLFEIGKELIGKRQEVLGIKWLTRANDVLATQELDKLSVDASELRLSIIQSMVKGFLGLQEYEASVKAQELINMLESEIGDKLILQLLKLELISSSVNEVFDSDAYANVLRRMVHTLVLSDANFKLIMHHIRKLSNKSPGLACKTLDEFLQRRILGAAQDEWVETILINRIWMTTSLKDGQDVLESVANVLETVASNIDKPISSSAVHAAQALLWKRIESNYSSGQYEAAETWCRLSLHRAFEMAGDLNKTKIARKGLLCALARRDTSCARETFESMSEAGKSDATTCFLMYKIAIRCGDVDLAAEFLDKVYERSLKDSILLYACALDAQEVGDKAHAIAALQLVLQKHEYNVPSSIHLPALLRCTIRLIVAEVELESNMNHSSSIGELVNQLCKLFEGATCQAQKSLISVDAKESHFNNIELDWFSKNSYNLALKNATEWEPCQVLRIIESCINLMDLYPKDIGQQGTDDISLRRTFCNFLASVLLITIARAEDNIEVQAQTYLSVRRHAESFDRNLQDMFDRLEDGPANDLLKKLSILLAYDFEAAVKLKAWDDLGCVIIKADACKSMKVYELMCDCILSCGAPTTVVVETLKKLVNGAWSLENFDTVKMSRYMRCLFQHALSGLDSTAETLLEQIRDIARQSRETDQPYPAEELEWIATTAFNKSIDYYSTGADLQCRTWAGHAITIASVCPDDGALQRQLETKFSGLIWES